MKLKLFLWVLVFWLSMGAVYLLSLYLDALKYQTGFQLTWSMVVTTTFVYIFWSVLTLVLYYVLKKPIEKGNVLSCVVVFVLGMVIGIFLITLLDNVVYRVFEQQGWPVWSDIWKNLRYVSIFFNAILYVVVFIICGGVIYQQYSQKMKLAAIEMERSITETEYQLVNMKMQALHGQLSPHFLFNCLNAISALARMTEKNKVIKAIARLGDLLRFAISASKQTFISLNDELEFIENYVDLQKLRLGDSFALNLTYDKRVYSRKCPPFILHTLVENAIAHGGCDEKQLNVTVDIKLLSGQLVFSVSNSNTGVVMSEVSKGLGIALDNLKSRLTLLYGDAYSITTEQQSQQFTAVVMIPKDDNSYATLQGIETEFIDGQI